MKSDVTRNLQTLLLRVVPREKNTLYYEGGVRMDTRFEINIKNIGVKGDDSALCVYFYEKLALKLEYADIKTALKFLIKAFKQQ